MGAPVYSDLRRYLLIDTHVHLLEEALDKSKAIDAAISQIERQFGKGSIMRMGDEERQSVASIPTGALALDLALHIIAEAQRAGGLAAFIDAEHALDPTYAQAIGVDLENLYFSQPDNGEQ